jgi:hypothetical protein
MADFGDEYKKLSDERFKIYESYGWKAELCTIDQHNRIEELTKALRAIEEHYDMSHPIEPCSDCGGKRKASLNGICLNFKSCKLPKK